ncbi:MAG: hypothetical protein M0R48_07305 [Candidatus Omnitrophica bacterium]|jgi:hypothetical protein|nr:hypothetical protein [Candidatus Omnitrophota bacterium]
MPKKKIWSGDFEVKNNLLYYLPAEDDKLNVGHALKVVGKWDITKNGRLRFIVDNSQNQIFGKTISVGSELSRVNTGSLEFRAAHRITPTGKNVKTIALSGELTALAGKKLAFEIEREGAIDTLKLNGTWDVFDGNQIGCLIKRTCSGKQITNSVALKGTWEIAGNILSYQVEKSNKPFLAQEFEIKRAIYTDKESGIDFTLGADLRCETARRGASDTVSLKGTWKQDGAKAEFIFTSARRQSFTFILSRKLSNDKELVFELDTGEDRKPSFTLTFAKKIKGDSSFFIRGKISEKEKRAEAGFYFPF